MARFQFRLKTLQRLREINRDEQRHRLATAYEAERILGAQRAALAVESAELAELHRKVLQQKAVDVTRLLAGQRYQLALQSQSQILADQAAKLADEVEHRRSALVESDREVRILEKLENRQCERHLAAQLVAETKTLDEIAAHRWKAAET